MQKMEEMFELKLQKLQKKNKAQFKQVVAQHLHS